MACPITVGGYNGVVVVIVVVLVVAAAAAATTASLQLCYKCCCVFWIQAARHAISLTLCLFSLAVVAKCLMVTHISVCINICIIVYVMFMAMTVYGAVIMARPLQEFTRFIWWMQIECQIATNLQTKPTKLAFESASRLLSSTSTITIYYYYSARKLVLIFLSHGWWKAELT